MARHVTAFVWRLHKDTTEDDLNELMSAAGLQEPHCYKLKAKDDHEFRTSLFQARFCHLPTVTMRLRRL